MAHIGVERLGPRNGEHDGAERDEGEIDMPRDEADAEFGKERLQHEGVLRNLDGAHDADDQEPDRHDGAEGAAHAAGAAALAKEQDDDNGEGKRVYRRGEAGGDDFQPCDGGEHGDGGGDHAVAEEEAGADNADDAEPGAGFVGFRDALGERHERQYAALAVIIGAHHESDVF